MNKRIMKLRKNFYLIVNAVIRALMILIISGMCLQSMFSTSFSGYITQEDGSRQERVLNIADRPWSHMLVLAVFILACSLLYRIYCLWEERKVRAVRADIGHSTVNDCKKSHYSAYQSFSILIFLVGILWVLITQLEPGSDPSKVYRIAMQWREGNFSSYAEGGYLFRYPFQDGIILFYYFLSFLFGIGNYVGFQFVNVVALTVIYLLLSKLTAMFWRDERMLPAIVYAALILWPPFTLYVTYLYGILPGMALSLCAVYCTVKYLDTRKYRYILPAALCMGIATVLKMNCLIYMIAISCFLLYDAVDSILHRKAETGRRWIVSLVFIGLLSGSVMVCNRACDRYVEKLSGYEAGDGEAMISWVVMGLSDAPYGPGTYDGYIGDVFLEYEYDTEKIEQASMARIRKILTRMSENPKEDGIPFFARKNAFQWNDPSFLSLENTKGRTSAVDMPDLVQSFIDGYGSVTFYVLMNFVQTLVWFGVLFYLFINWRSENILELMGAVIFLGGFLFHFVWESGASYTIPYFVVIIPYAVKGYADLTRRADGLAESVRGGGGKALLKDVLVKNRIPIIYVAVILLFVALLDGRSTFRNTIALDDGSEAVTQFYHRGELKAQEQDSRSVLNAVNTWGGYCYLSPYQAQDKAVVPVGGEVTLVSVIPAGISESEDGAGVLQNSSTGVIKASDIRDIGNKVLIRQSEAGTIIRFRSNEQILAVDSSGEHPQLITYMDDGVNMFYESRSDVKYFWSIKPADSGGYYITMGDTALTYRDGRLTLENVEQSAEQVWVLQE